MKKNHCRPYACIFTDYQEKPEEKKTNLLALVSDTMFYVGTVVPLTLAGG